MKSFFNRFLDSYFLLVFILVSLFPVYIFIGNPIVTPGRLVLVVGFIFFCMLFVNSTVRKEFAFLLKKYDLLFVLFLLYFAFRAISISKSSDYMYSGGLVYLEFCQTLFMMCVGLLCGLKNTISRNTIKYVLLVFVVVCVYSVFEYLVGHNLLRQFANVESKASLAAASFSYRDSLYRSQGFFEHPLSLGHYLVVVIPLLIFTTRQKALILLVGGFAVLSTGSRAALVIYVFACALGFYFSKTSRVTTVKVISICFALCTVATFIYF